MLLVRVSNTIYNSVFLSKFFKNVSDLESSDNEDVEEVENPIIEYEDVIKAKYTQSM